MTCKSTLGHTVLSSWTGVPLPQKHNGSGLLQCDPCEGGEHQVVRAIGGWGVARALSTSFSSCSGEEGPKQWRRALLSCSSLCAHMWAVQGVECLCPSVGKKGGTRAYVGRWGLFVCLVFLGVLLLFHGRAWSWGVRLGCRPFLMNRPLDSGEPSLNHLSPRFRGWLVRRLCYFLWSLEQHIPTSSDASQMIMENTG